MPLPTTPPLTTTPPPTPPPQLPLPPPAATLPPTPPPYAYASGNGAILLPVVHPHPTNQPLKRTRQGFCWGCGSTEAEGCSETCNTTRHGH